MGSVVDTQFFCCVVVTKAENNILNIISMIRGVPGRYVGGCVADLRHAGRTGHDSPSCRTAWELTMLDAGTITLNIKIKQLMFVLHRN